MASSVSTIALIESTANEGANSRLWYTVSRREHGGGILGGIASSGGDDEWLAVKEGGKTQCSVMRSIVRN
jgi:hypothetical protein